MSREETEHKIFFVPGNHDRLATHVDLQLQNIIFEAKIALSVDKEAMVAALKTIQCKYSLELQELGRAVECARIAAEVHRPPRWAGFLFTVFAKSPDAADAAIGCMHERFVRDCAKYGVRHATFYCWAGTVHSLWPLFRRAIGRAVKWAAIISAVKRYFVG
jgi:hypothetical protein